MSAHEQFGEDLALYALDSLTGNERLALESHLAQCAACRRELEALRGDMSLLALTTAGPKPPVRSRERLMAAIAKEPRQATATRKKRHSWFGVFGWTAAVATTLLCVGLLRQNSGLSHDLGSLRAQFNDQEAQIQQASATIKTLIDPATQKIELVAAGAKPQPAGKAFYQKRNRNLIFVASALPQLAPEKIYELWLFPANGAPPIPAGLFKPDARGNATIVNPPLPEGVEAKNFAVTLEPESGSHEAPRGTPVIVGIGE